MLGVNMDVSELKRAEQALVQTNAQLEAILDSIPEPVMVTDAAGTLLRVNAAFRNSLVYQTTVDNYVGRVEAYREDGQFIPTEEWPINRVRRGERINGVDVILSIDGAKTHRRFSGSPVFNSAGDITHAIVTFFDITDQKRMARELRRANETMALALDAGNAGGWVWNLETRELDWTDGCYRLFGLDPTRKPSAELFYSVVHPGDLKRLKKSVEDAVQGRNTEFRTEFRVQHAAGVRWFERLGRVICNRDGKPIQMVGITADITERKILRGLLPTCAHCKKIRDEHDQWRVLEEFISERSGARFSHGLCPDCLNEYEEASGVQEMNETSSVGGR